MSAQNRTETDGGQHDTGTDPDEATHASQKSKKTCEWVDDYTDEACGKPAVKAVWMRNDSRVNEHGIHITTEVRPVFVCEDHEHRGDDVPDAEAEVVTR